MQYFYDVLKLQDRLSLLKMKTSFFVGFIFHVFNLTEFDFDESQLVLKFCRVIHHHCLMILEIQIKVLRGLLCITFLYPLKISGNQRFSDVFRGYRKRHEMGQYIKQFNLRIKHLQVNTCSKLRIETLD